MLLVSLHVLSKLVLAMPVEIDCLSSDDSVWAEIGQHTVGMRECIQPVYGVLRLENILPLIKRGPE
jgi:hypothetical protein